MKRLHPRAIWLFFLSSLIAWYFIILLVGLAFIFTMSEIVEITLTSGLFVWLVISALLLAVIFYVWAKMYYHFYRYELTDSSFRKELGVINKKYVTIPYGRIQNVDIHRGILSRILGLSDLHIQTAGSAVQMSGSRVHSPGAEGRLPALSRKDAEQLRDELIIRSERSSNKGL